MALTLKKENIKDLVASVTSAGASFVAPSTEARLVRYRPVADAAEVTLDYVIPVNSAKEYLFPQTETIADFSIRKEGVTLTETPVEPVETVIFGVRPCDAASLASLRSVFTWDFIDETYTRREDKAVMISIACTEGDASCFCTAVGLAPDTDEGSDVLLRETASGDFAVEAVTEKGKVFLEGHRGAFEEGDAGELKEIFTPEKLDVDIDKISARLKETDHYDEDIWPELARKCFGCGACTFSCPTCHCFDITDEGTAFDGERKKNWDACQFDHFTLHAGGHNPRDAQYKRWRNRFMCKFNFYPEKFKQKGCVGCGRCVRVCPVRLDITEVMEEFSR